MGSDTMREIAVALAKSITPGSFVGASGATLWHKCDIPPLLEDDRALAAMVGEIFLEQALRKGLFRVRVLCVGGKTEGARSLVNAMALAIRNNPRWRGYGLESYILERNGQITGGRPPSDQPMVVVEDVLTSGKSALEAADAFQQRGAHVEAMTSLICRRKAGLNAVEARGIAPFCFFRFSHILAPELHADIPDLY